jgi:hypothetical protein
VADDILRQIKTAKTPTELWQVRQNVDEVINFGIGDASSVPGAQQIARAARKEINKSLESIQGYKELAGSYSKAKDVVLLSAEGAKTPRGIQMPGTMRTVAGPQAQQVRAVAGNLARKGSNVQQSLTQALTSPAMQGVQNAATGGVIQGLGKIQSPGENNDMSAPTMNSQINSSNITELSANGDGMSTVNQTPWLPDGISGPLDPVTRQPIQQSPYTRESLLADIQRDPKNMNDYISYYESLQEIFAPQQMEDAKPLTQFQQERSDLISALGMTEQAVEGGSINFGPIGARVEGIKSVFNRADPETLAYKNVVSGLRAAITKARAGASLTAGELKMLQQYTPSDTDSEQVVRSKLASLRQLYGYEQPQGGLTLQDALSMAQ